MEANSPEELRFDFAVDEREASPGTSDTADPALDEQGERRRADAAQVLSERLAGIRAVAARQRRAPVEVRVGERAVIERPAAQVLPDAEVVVVEHFLEELIAGAPPEDDPFTDDLFTDEVFVDDAYRDDGIDEVPEPDALSIAEFYERVRGALAREFSDEIWVTGEIRGLKESRGHHYIELADHDTERGARNSAQLEVVCWAREWPTVAAALSQAGVELEVGRVVRVRGRVSVWDGGSKLRFTLTALDVEALLGGIAAARHRLLTALAAEDLVDANRRHRLALVPLRIGLVTSPGSEAHRDFTGQLTRSGFAFQVRLERSLVQGADAPEQIAAALKRLEVFAPDLAVVVRGGGARADLAAFDSEPVARAIATAPFPVWTGIGHTGDRSVADELASLSAITPTACGEAVVARVAAYWEQIAHRVRVLTSLAGARLDTAAQRLSGSRHALSSGVRHQLDRHQVLLTQARRESARGVRTRLSVEQALVHARAGDLGRATGQLLERCRADVVHGAQMLRAYDPRRQLERGWSLAHDEHGVLVRSVGQLEPGSRISVRVADGSADARVETIREEVGVDE